MGYLWLERTYNPRTFRFVGRFNSPDPELSPTTTITTFDPGKNVNCKETPKTISKNEWRTRCERKDDSPITIVVNATKGPIRGGGTLDLPEIARFPPKLAKPICTLRVGEVDFDGDKCADSFGIEASRMIVKLSKNGRYVQIPSNNPAYNAELGFWLSGDFDGDGVTDLLHMVTKDSGGGRLDYNHVHFSKGNGGFRAPTKFAFPCAANPQCDYNTSLGNWTAREIDSDGKTDLVHNPQLPDNRKHCWFSLGDGRFQLRGCPPL